MVAGETLLTIGLFGAWGAGKSTLGALISKLLRQRKYICIRLNPWKWGKIDDVYDVVLKELQAELIASGFRMHAWFSILLRSIQANQSKYFWILTFVFFLILGVFTISDEFTYLNAKTLANNSILVFLCAALVKFIFDLAGKHLERKILGNGPGNITSETLSLAYRHIAWFERVLLRSGSKPMVFFIDDLDRCPPNKVAAVLESIHGFTMAGCVTFLLCDRDYIEAALYAQYEAVAKHHPDGVNFSRRYLDKIVQVAFHLPAVTEADLIDLELLSRPGTGLTSGTQQDFPEGRSKISDYSRMEQSMLQDTPPGDHAVDYACLSELAGEFILDFVQEIGLNIRQIKSLRNTLKLYLTFTNPANENEARRVSAFVLMNAIDRDWLDDHYYGVTPKRQRFPDLNVFYDRIEKAIPHERNQLRSLFRLLGRHPVGLTSI